MLQASARAHPALGRAARAREGGQQRSRDAAAAPVAAQVRGYPTLKSYYQGRELEAYDVQLEEYMRLSTQRAAAGSAPLVPSASMAAPC